MLRNLPLFLLVVLCACNSRETRSTVVSADSSGSETEVVYDTVLSGDFYKRYSGTVGGKPVVAHLQNIHGRLEGSYQYLSQGKVIELRDYDDTTGDEVRQLTEIVPGQTTESAGWSITIQGRSATGEWLDPKTGARSPISLTEDYPQGSMQLKAFSVVDTQSLFANKPKGPRASSEYSYLLQPRNADSVNAILARQIFPDHVSGEDLTKSIRKSNQQYFESYRNDNASLELSAEQMGFSLNYEQEVSQRVIYNDNDWLVVELFTSSFTGGAHGNYSSGYTNIDRASGWAWELTGMISDTAALRPLLNEAAIVYFDIKPGTRIGDRLLVKEVPVTPNVYLSATGLCFVYNPYEIASYADGEIKLFIPFTRLQPLLHPSFRERMHLTTQTGGVQRI